MSPEPSVSFPLKPIRRSVRAVSVRNAPEPHAGSQTISSVRVRRSVTAESACSTILRASGKGVKWCAPRVTGLLVLGGWYPNKSDCADPRKAKCASWKIALAACRIASTAEKRRSSSEETCCLNPTSSFSRLDVVRTTSRWISDRIVFQM
jgi:hypothetical protein